MKSIHEVKYTAGIAMVLTLMMGPPAHSQAAWDVSEKWFCRAERLTSCDPDGLCSNGPSKIALIVDFKANTTSNLAVYGNMADIREKVFEGGASYFSSWIGSMGIIREVKDGPMTNYMFKLAIFGFPGGTMIHYGSCSRL